MSSLLAEQLPRSSSLFCSSPHANTCYRHALYPARLSVCTAWYAALELDVVQLSVIVEIDDHIEWKIPRFTIPLGE